MLQLNVVAGLSLYVCLQKKCGKLGVGMWGVRQMSLLKQVLVRSMAHRYKGPDDTAAVRYAERLRSLRRESLATIWGTRHVATVSSGYIDVIWCCFSCVFAFLAGFAYCSHVLVFLIESENAWKRNVSAQFITALYVGTGGHPSYQALVHVWEILECILQHVGPYYDSYCGTCGALQDIEYRHILSKLSSDSEFCAIKWYCRRKEREGFYLPNRVGQRQVTAPMY